MARGEVRFPSALQVVDVETLEDRVNEPRDQALALAEEGHCVDAEDAWWKAKMYRPRATAWFAIHRPEMARALADCWVRTAETSPDDPIDFLEKAREWDHWAPALRAATKPLAADLYKQGRAAMAVEDWERAYQRFSDVLRIQPHHAWARRYAEQARPYRLAFDDESLAEEKRQREARQADLEKRRKEREENKTARPGPKPLRPTSKTAEVPPRAKEQQ